MKADRVADGSNDEESGFTGALNSSLPSDSAGFRWEAVTSPTESSKRSPEV